MYILLLSLLLVADEPTPATPSVDAAATTPSVEPSTAGAPSAPATASPPTTARMRLVILDMSANDVDAALVKTVSEGVAVTFQKAKVVDDVVSAADLRAVMNIAASKQATGSCEATESCMAEIAQALGADVLVHGSVGRYGSLYAVTLSIFDGKANRAIAREKVESAKLELLSRRTEYAAKRLALAYEGKSPELAGSEPTEPSAIGAPLLWAGVGVGALGATGVVVGVVLASTATTTLEDPLSSGANKATAQTSHPVFLTVAIGSGAVAAAGAALVFTSFFME